MIIDSNSLNLYFIAESYDCPLYPQVINQFSVYIIDSLPQTHYLVTNINRRIGVSKYEASEDYLRGILRSTILKCIKNIRKTNPNILVRDELRVALPYSVLSRFHKLTPWL